MVEAPQPGGILAFDSFSLDGGRGCLLVDGVEVPLRPKTFALLAYLAANPGRLVSKDELIRAIWRGAIVSDDVLVQSVGELRRALGEKGAAIIRTVPRRGYRFDAEVTAVAPASGFLPTADPPAQRRRWPLYGAALALLAAALSVGAWKSERNARVVWTKPVVLVLPFEKAGAPGLEDSADPRGDLITALSRFSSLAVKSGAAMQPDRDTTAERTAARDPDVPYQIVGSVRYTAERIHVMAQLEGPDGHVLWPGDFDERQADALVLKQKLGQFAAQAAFKVLEAEQQLAAARSPGHPDAYDYVQRALYDLRNGDQREPHAGVVKAREQMKLAIGLDPNYAEARSLLAETYLATVMGGYSQFPDDDLEEARLNVRSALALDARNIRAHVVMAQVYLLTKRPERARTEVDGLLEINPNDPYGLAARGTILVWLGETDAAIETLKAVSRIASPLGAFNMGGPDNLALALAYYLKGRYQDAIDTLAPPDPLPKPPIQDVLAAPLALLAACHAQLNDMERARQAAQLVRDTDPAMTLKMQDYGAQLRNAADRERLRDGLVKAGLLPSSEVPTR